MAFTFGFYNSIDHDRRYNAQQMSAIFDGIITDGVFDSIGEIFATVPGDGMQVLVKTGKAWFNHTWSINDSYYPLDIDPSDILLDRIDAVVLEVNNTDTVRANSLKIVKGTNGSTPQKPALIDTENVHQHPLAYVTIRKQVESIAAADISIVVGQTACPFVTGLLDSVDITDLFNKWNGEFDDWFNDLQTQLSDNVVTNLQSQINARVKISDKATVSDLASGSDDKWVSAKMLKEKGLNATFVPGDMITTLRTASQMGNDWALADGHVIDAAIYPEFAEACPSMPEIYDSRVVTALPTVYSGASLTYQCCAQDGPFLTFIARCKPSSDSYWHLIGVSSSDGGKTFTARDYGRADKTIINSTSICSCPDGFLVAVCSYYSTGSSGYHMDYYALQVLFLNSNGTIRSSLKTLATATYDQYNDSGGSIGLMGMPSVLYSDGVYFVYAAVNGNYNLYSSTNSFSSFQTTVVPLSGSVTSIGGLFKTSTHIFAMFCSGTGVWSVSYTSRSSPYGPYTATTISAPGTSSLYRILIINDKIYIVLGGLNGGEWKSDRTVPAFVSSNSNPASYYTDAFKMLSNSVFYARGRYNILRRQNTTTAYWVETDDISSPNSSYKETQISSSIVPLENIDGNMPQIYNGYVQFPSLNVSSGSAGAYSPAVYLIPTCCAPVNEAPDPYHNFVKLR